MLAVVDVVAILDLADPRNELVVDENDYFLKVSLRSIYLFIHTQTEVCSSILTGILH